MFHRTTRLTTLLVLVTLLSILFGTQGNPASVAQAGTTATPPRPGLIIPLGQSIPQLDGTCNANKYSDAIARPFNDAGGSGTVYLKHDDTNLYVCVQAKPGVRTDRFETVYLDPQGDGSSYEFARKDDYGLKVGILSNARTSLVGSDVANGYVPAPAGTDGFWSGKATAAAGQSESIEYSIEIGRFKLGECGKLFGIAAYHHWISAVGDDYGFPSNQWFDQPGTWEPAQLDGVAPCPPAGRGGKIAYVYRGNRDDAVSFYNLLVANGYSVDMVPLSIVTTTDFSGYNLIIIADDTGALNSWGSGTAANMTNQVAKITAPNKPILGLGEGGYAFFGRLSLFIGWPNGWHGPQTMIHHAPGAPASYYASPNAIPPADPVVTYATPVNEVGIYLGSSVPSDVVPIGVEPPAATGAPSNHAPLIIQNCRQLWGFSGNPTTMAALGQNLFINAVEYASLFQCAPQIPPQVECIISKSANPAAGTPVVPGQVIVYTITYTNCKATALKLIDSIPPDTIYVPGSASDGIAPGADGALVWSVAPGSGTKTFKVWVSDTQCHNQRTVVNRAGLLIPGEQPAISNVVSHPVTCPPITFPNDQPPYAEDEIQVNPYPLITGTPSDISVRISNTSASAQAITVSFQTSPNRFGIGLDFNTFATKTVTVPANSNVIVKTTFTPVSSGHYCIQVKVQGTGFAPIYTQRNLDVTENLQPGHTDTLTFKVRNDSNVTTDILLDVDNTCPGWTATVNPTLLTNMAPGEVRNAQLLVTPPNPVTLGSACHIDVRGWIGDRLIGGIRKLDVPPVHLPTGIDPPWLEPEISVIPNPPVVGQPTQLCVQLQNPLGISRVVTLVYAVADFGAGIPFTTVATTVVTLPPNSNATYCITWTPALGGTLHRCVLITLKQNGYQDQSSQHNFDLIRRWPGQLGDYTTTVRVHNPDIISHTLRIDPLIYGLDPFWKIHILPDPPPELGPGEDITLDVGFTPGTTAFATPAATLPANIGFGDETRIDMAVYLDDEQVGGFTLSLDQSRLYLPLMIH